MKNKKILPVIISVITLSALMSGFSISKATENKLGSWQEEIQVKANQVEEFKESIEQEINKNGVLYKLDNVSEKENSKTLTKDEKVEKQLIVNTKDRENVLDLFDQELKIKKDGYIGTLKIDNSSLRIKPNDIYEEEYKLYYEEKYENVKRNELNNVPKIIKKNGTTYYLVNPVWTISKTEKIDGQDIPISYDGTMKYEAIKKRIVINNYIATVSYFGKIEKEVIDTVTVKVQYKEVPKKESTVIETEKEQKSSITAPVVTAGAGIIICSGIIFISRKNISIYNYQNNNWKLVRKEKVKASEKLVDITPQNNEISRKYKIVLKNDLYTKWYGQNITVKYFDKQFICNVKENEIEILV